MPTQLKILPFLVVGFILLLIAINKPTAIQAPAPVTPISPVLPTPPVPPTPRQPQLGDNVQWRDLKPFKTLSDPSWGNVLTDIENHLDPKLGTQYRDADKITWAHETTHGIHSYLNNTFGRYGLYVGDGKFTIIQQPKVKLSQIAATIAEAHRQSRYQLYFHQQQKYFENDPIYPFDEWVAYCNGAACGVEIEEKGLHKHSQQDSVWSVLEFNVYALYVCMATEKYDPSYDKKQLLEFTAYNIKRGMALYHRGNNLACFNWDKDKYLTELRTGAASAELRAYTIRTFGAEWAKEVMGF